MRRTAHFFVLPTLAVTGLLVAQAAQAHPIGSGLHRIAFEQGVDTATAQPGPNFDGEVLVNAIPSQSGVSDYSTMGEEGYWFFNFNATAPVTGALPESNDRRALPSWVSINLDPTDPAYTFSSPATGGEIQAFSEGGNSAWSQMTLPTAAAEAGLSGSMVTPGSNGDSDNAIHNITLGPGVPSTFLWSFVLDNTGPGLGDYDFSKRLKVRALADGQEVNMRLNKLQDVDGSPDIYTFRFGGWGDGDVLRLQVRSSAGHPAGIAGMLFDVPEPSSIALGIIGLAAIVGFGWRRRS